jgi:predicted acylesterase/phospholipase RssA
MSVVPNKKYCDLIMKGGVTSGVVYPLAVCELASEYWFKNIGGTSAGAIAAGVTAAAECGRRRKDGDDAGFQRLAQLPTDLATNNFLLSLFKPDPQTSRVFEVLLAGMEAKQARKSILAAGVPVLCRNFAKPLIVGLAIPVLPIVLLWYVLRGAWISYVLLACLSSLIVGAYLTIRAILRQGNASLLQNRFGFCSGFDPTAKNGQPPLTNWLYQLLQVVARQKEDKPLTFGDLWNAPPYRDETEPVNDYRCVEFDSRRINFEVVTTNLTLGCPSRIPFDTKMFYFDPTEWSQLFPREVVKWMEDNPYQGARLAHTTDQRPLVSIPEMADFPVIAAIRMSLSFPLLLSAVPLYAVDYTLEKNQGLPKTQSIEAEKCWFSDGGISSNFPIHFFDAPLPRWPTFGINLKTPHPDHNNEEGYVWLPTKNIEGLQESWNRFEGHGLFGFLGAIVNVMQNWRDNLQMLIPGYRDRIVHISHTDREGGLNLRMDPEVIKRMSERGRRAGQEILDKFNFENHVWVRYRSTMCCLETTFEKFRNAYLNPVPQDQAIWPIFGGKGSPPSYTWKRSQAEWAGKATGDLVNLIDCWSQTGNCFCDGAPKPRPELRVVPKV